MVKTPWFDEAVPFNMAAELGTQKVIAEHSTVGLVVTTDGSVTDIPREEYAAAEERVISELKALGKPFAVLLNCVHPHSTQAQDLDRTLEERYEMPVMAVGYVPHPADQRGDCRLAARAGAGALAEDCSV